MLLCLFSLNSFAAPAVTDETSELELTNFAFATYLGSGFYSSGNLKLFVLRIPLSSKLSQPTEEKAGLKLRYPVTVGVARIDDEINLPEIGDIIDVNNLATVSVVPGLEYGVMMTNNWYLGPFVDLGIARDFANNTNIGVGGVGAKSLITLDYDHGRLVIANRLLYAQQNNLESSVSTHFSSFETGLEYSFASGFTFGESPVDFSFYFINYHYIDDLVIGGPIEDRISLENKNEAGFTFSLPKHDWLPDNSRLGLGVQVTRNSDFYRIVFGSPFF